MTSALTLQVGVKILLQNAAGEYLLLRRNAEKYPEAAKQWDIPGGRIDPGSTLLENLKREVYEETQLKLRAEPQLVAAQDILKVPGRHVVRLTYTGVTEGDPVLDEEHDDYLWCTREALIQLVGNGLDPYCAEVLREYII